MILFIYLRNVFFVSKPILNATCFLYFERGIWPTEHEDQMDIFLVTTHVMSEMKKVKGSWICIAPHCEKLASSMDHTVTF